MSDNTAKLTAHGQALDLPVLSPTLGPDVVDIRKLYGQAGVFTYDPGFTSTAACDSAITFIDGEKGELLHRGYPIDQLAERSHFLEVCYLLLYGELPGAAQMEDFDQRVTRHTMLHEQMINFFRGFRRDAHPMAVMVGVVGAMSAFYHDSTDINDPWQREGGDDPADRQDAHDRRDGLQVQCRPALRVPAQRPRLCQQTSSGCASRCRPSPTWWTRCWPARWTVSSHSTPTTSRTPRPRRCASPPPRAPTPSLASPPASPAFGGPRMAARTRPRWRCCARSAPWTASPSISPAPRTRTTRSA